MEKTNSIEFALEDPRARAVASVEIRYGEGGVRTALRLLAKACLEVLVRAREVDGTHAPAQVQSREADGSRWSG